MSLPMSVAEEWYGKICRLKVDRARQEPAPHKPLLLLVFFDMLEAGQLSGGLLELTPSPERGFLAGPRREEAAHQRAEPGALRPD